MDRIATFTMNPTIDAAYETDRVFHTHKMRTQGEHYDPGGGGINISRVIARLGGTARAYYASGGATGVALDGLLDLHQMVRHRIPIAGSTRISASLYDRESGKEYRVVPAGPSFTEEECERCLAEIAQAGCDYFVASGSLAPGVPEDFYARALAACRQRGIRFVLDTSGAALKATLDAGGVFLVKPSLGELQALVGKPLEGLREIADAARAFVQSGQTHYMAVTMGHEGALLAHGDEVVCLPTIAVQAMSAVGAGDSFLAAMVFALANGRDVTEAFRYGIAAGAAAVLTPGTDLCRREDVERLYREVAPLSAARVIG
ncbi:putative 6-phosphofructokinase [Sphingobium sp. SYK-6]|uniref:1-phosphofructokinase family hexose kinase n=1 Tax=Sphingobium sp. (strain NBRC 103272 / SYK-6) TaxID=627192 RepID=UPI0002277668|nr:1-phosphofructokinase family hexose kinase [Sphingobium sp. SYK-6]BAK66716.1 putative 6-phosphofructokinase [Sphingobium sp. SYK-6]